MMQLDRKRINKLGADLVALAAQEGNNGEDWQKIQEAGFLVIRLAESVDGFMQVTTELRDLWRECGGMVPEAYALCSRMERAMDQLSILVTLNEIPVPSLEGVNASDN